MGRREVPEGSMNFESTLNDKQKAIKKKFLSSRSKPHVFIEEDCCGTADYHYEIHPSGIGDTVYLVCNGERTWLDDGLDA